MFLRAILCGREIGFIPLGKTVNVGWLTNKNAEESIWTYEKEVAKRTEKNA
jgi:hypothetical protein